jgi:hypothetical protein
MYLRVHNRQTMNHREHSLARNRKANRGYWNDAGTITDRLRLNAIADHKQKANDHI